MSAFGHIGRGWNDLQGSIEVGDAVSALTQEAYRDTDLEMRFFRHDQDDELQFIYQLDHGWNFNHSVNPHIHVIPMSNGSGDVVISGSYVWLINGYELPAASGWTSYKTTYSFVAADQYKAHVISIGDIDPPAGAALSTILCIRMIRPGSSDGDDTYTTAKDHGTGAANLGLLSADLHYRKIKVGSVDEYGAY